MLPDVLVVHGWEPMACFGMCAAAFFGALLCLRLYTAGKGRRA